MTFLEGLQGLNPFCLMVPTTQAAVVQLHAVKKPHPLPPGSSHSLRSIQRPRFPNDYLLSLKWPVLYKVKMACRMILSDLQKNPGFLEGLKTQCQGGKALPCSLIPVCQSTGKLGIQSDICIVLQGKHSNNKCKILLVVVSSASVTRLSPEEI